MLSLILIGSIFTPLGHTKPVEVKVVPFNENVARYCAYKSNIPYASDDFTEVKWIQFKTCYNSLSIGH